MEEPVVFDSPDDFRRTRAAVRHVEGVIRGGGADAGRGAETLRAGEVVLQVTGAKDSVGVYPCKLVESPLPAYGLAKEYADATGLPTSPPPPAVPPVPSSATWSDPEVAHTGYLFEINDKDLSSASGRNRYKATLIGTYEGKGLYVCDLGSGGCFRFVYSQAITGLTCTGGDITGVTYTTVYHWIKNGVEYTEDPGC